MTDLEKARHKRRVMNNPGDRFYKAKYSVSNKTNKSTVILYSYFRSNIPISLAEDIIDRNTAELYNSNVYEYNKDLEVISYHMVPPNTQKGIFISQEEYDSYSQKIKLVV